MFRDYFKYYKAKKPPPDLKDVVDVNDDKNVIKTKKLSDLDNKPHLGLKNVNKWEIFEFVNIPGLILIKNPFTVQGQQKWITKCLKDFTMKPNILNIDAHNLLKPDENWWSICFKSPDSDNLRTKLRWVTLGYHHNWDSKQYSEDFKTEMASDLKELTEYFAQALNFSGFKAEAAIINYYRMNSTLAGHTDKSEVCLEAPLFSISFGQTCIFLIGGLQQEDSAKAIFLRSGDVIVMSGESRLRYHGVPKILYDNSSPWDSNISNNYPESIVGENDWGKAKTYISEARININVRQVLRPGQTTLK